MTPEVFIPSLIVVFAATLVMSVTGFGFAVLAAPLLLFFHEPKTVVVISILLSAVVSVLIQYRAWRQVDISRTWLIGVAGAFGIPLGAYIVARISSAGLQLAIATLAFIFAIPLALGYSHQFRREKLGLSLCGFASGVLASSTSMGGPPTVLFCVNQGWDKETLRATFAAYFGFFSLLALVALGLSGVLTGERLLLASAHIPILIPGFYLGMKLLPRINQRIFKIIVLVTVLLAALAGMINSISVLL